MDEKIRLEDYGIDLPAIKQSISNLSTKKVKDLKEEQLTSDTKEKYQNFAKEHLGFEFSDISLFITALTHRSYVNEHRKVRVEHNERLEFLGDAILEIVVSDFLYRNFTEPEGVMTAWRAALVRTESILAASEEIGYRDLIRLSRGEQIADSKTHDKLVADCFEAVTGAIYLDKGFGAAKKHVYKYILPRMQEIIDNELWRDPKSYLQELAQKTDSVTPSYRTIKEDGPDHSREFTVVVEVGGKIRGQGTGHNKQIAEQEAAREGIKYYKSLKNTIDNGKLSVSNL